jgi:hypothetical protein
VEQTGRLEELQASFSVNGEAEPPLAIWTCPVCHGAPQQDPIQTTSIIGLEHPPLDLMCHCGHAHGDHAGCGYGAKVTLPDSVLEGSQQ